MYSLICFLSVCFPKAEVYIHPWLDLVEGFALGSFFLLLCDYVSPHHEQRELFFAAEKLGGVKWFRASDHYLTYIEKLLTYHRLVGS
jgi:hypothetical protein